MADWIKFMGTAGARFVVSKQLRSSAGTWCNLQGQNILIDPGPGTLSRCFSVRPKLNPEHIDAIILTHRHLDHSTDINVMIEAMTRGTFEPRGALFVPSDAIEAGNEPVVFRHTRNSMERLELLQIGKEFTIGPVRFTTPVLHRHPVETYGLVFDLPEGRVSFITDTAYFPELIEHYRDSDILIINVVLYEIPAVRQIQHLDLAGAKKLVQGIRPRLMVMTHFGLNMLHHKPYLLAQQLAEETGIPVKAATDGMILVLDEILNG